MTTYIQSGNVVFKATRQSDKALAKKIQEAIYSKYNFEVPVINRSVEEVRNIIAANPLLKDSNIDAEKLHVTFLEEVPDKTKVDALKTLIIPLINLSSSVRKFFFVAPTVMASQNFPIIFLRKN